MLLGLGPYSNQQTGYPVQLFDQINQITIRAWKSIPNEGEVSGNLTKIVQGPMEPFSDFVARVLEAAGRVATREGLWRGPDPVLTWARGSVCVFPQDQQDPVWVPECLVRKVQHEECPECQHGDPSAPLLNEPAGGGGRTEVGHPLSVSKTDTGDV
ncbi:Retrovirus-related Gag polyprotein [Cricetulus griseus]|uniref:Retrovirus-related Gag polyprotein n=1 Tax=Cricetulus griseus TaxID=10029 RepID=G3HPN3_CRIGR|nr:Retrovirus-related Gag polyprotein [Cricetulus griseus]